MPYISHLAKCSFLMMLALICVGGQVRAQESPAGTDTLEWTSMTDKEHFLVETVITGQYAPSTVERAIQKIRVVDRKKIDAMNAQNLRDVLTNELNIRLSQDNVLGSGLSLQGISGQNVKILIDGVPVVGRQDGNIDISQLNLNNIERIEIIEGPMSVNYGTDALAGTINLITKKTQSRQLETSVNTYYESVGTYNANARVGFSKKEHTVGVSGGRHFFDGWNPGQPQFNLDFSDRPADSARYQQWKPKEQYFGDLLYGYRLRKLSLNYRGSYFREKITNRGLPRPPYGENSMDDYYRTYRFDNAAFMNLDVAEDRKLNIQFAYNQYKRIRNTYVKDLTTLEEIPSIAQGDQDTSRYNLFNSRGTFATSRQSRKFNYEVGYDINLEYATGRRIQGQDQYLGDFASFISTEYRPWKDLTIRPGLRYAYNTGYNAPLIPSLHIRSQPIKSLTLRGSYARGFRAPTLKELYFDFVDVNHDITGNTTLEAEYSNNYNLSANYQFRKNSVNWKLEGSAFYNDIRNQITLAQTGPNAEYSYVNIGVNRTKGLQAGAEARYKGLSAGIGGAYIGRYNELSEEEAGSVSVFSYSPEIRGNLVYDFTKYGISAALFYKYTGKLPGFNADAAGNIYATDIDAYQIADLSVSKSFLEKKMILALGCKNIFDVQNINRMAAGSSGGAHSSGGTAVPIGTGRTYFLRLNININSEL